MLKRKDLALMLRREAIAECVRAVRSESRGRRLLISLLHDADEEVRWKAIRVLGAYARQLYTENPEQVRRILRQLLWHMNDESGGVIFCAPQAMGEILAEVPELVREYVPVLASFVHEEPFEAGTLWALWRIGPDARDEIKERQHEFLELLQGQDPQILGHAIILANAWGMAPKGDVIQKVIERGGSFTLYDYRQDRLIEKTIAEAAGG
ncbi:DVU0298 family protein [Acidobacteriota bacterium]